MQALSVTYSNKCLLTKFTSGLKAEKYLRNGVESYNLNS